MKIKFYWVALLASAALIAQTQAGNQHGDGGGNFAAPAHAGPAHAAPGNIAAPGFHSAPRGNFGGGRFMAPGPRFSSTAAPNAFRQQRVIGSNVGQHRFDPARTLSHRESRLARNGNRFENRGANAPRAHVFGRRTANWHGDWDRRHDHWWHGHRCHFVNGYWFIYDIGFYPYDYGYPSDYYAYDSYPYGYDPGVYEGVEADYYSQGGSDSSAQSTDSTVAAAQEQLARQGYYRGEIDGVFGAETRRAIMRYQNDHGLRVTGRLNMDTLRALGLPRVASN